MISLGRRLVAGLTACTALVVGVACAAVWWGARWHAYRSLADELADRAGMAGHFASTRRHRPDHDAPVPPQLRAGDGSVFIQVLAADGGEVGRSPSLAEGGEGLAPALSGLPEGRERRFRLADGRWLLGCRQQIDTARFRRPRPPWEEDSPEESGVVLTALVAVDASLAERELVRLAAVLVLVWVLATALALAGGLWLRRAVLAPVHRLAAAIGAIDPACPGTRIAAAVPVEMTVVVERLGELLARLDRVVERERATLAALAHELRTPVAGLRTALEFSLLAEAPASAPDLARRCLPTVAAMQAVIANLLLLARIEAGRAVLELRAVDLEAAIADAWRGLMPRAAARGMPLALVPGAPAVRSAPDQLALVLANALGNAVEHGRPGSAIEVAAVRTPGGVRLTVANPFDGSAPDPARVFEPLWRGDPARSQGAHCGLGLALVQRVLRLLGGSAAAVVDEDRFILVVDLPAAGG